MIEAVIYDLDDTMVNSHPLHERAWDGLLEPHGHTINSIPKDMQISFVGRRIHDIVGEIVDYLQLEVDREELYHQRIEVFLKIAEKELEPMPGLVASLKRFKKAGLKLAIASSGAKKYIHIVLQKFEIAQYFDVVITGDDVTKGKPHPETYLTAAKKLGLKPEACVVLEDATKGIESAKGAGCKCIAIKNPNVPPQDYSLADLVVDTLDNISVSKLKKLA